MIPSTTESTLVARRAGISGMIEEFKELPQVDCPVTHRFADGVYLREIFMPKGTIIIGKIHSTQHFNIILSGDVTIATTEGVWRAQGGHTFISEAGVQKIVVMHEDCVWQTIHPTHSKNLVELEKELIVDRYDQLEVDGIMDKVRGIS